MIEDGETLDAASALDLARLGAGVAGLEAIVVFLRDPSHTYAHWVSSGDSHSRRRASPPPRSRVARGLTPRGGRVRRRPSSTRGHAARARRAALLFVEPMGRFGVAFVFASSAPLGLARLAVRRLCASLHGELALVASAGGARSVDAAACEAAQVVAPQRSSSRAPARRPRTVTAYERCSRSSRRARSTLTSFACASPCAPGWAASRSLRRTPCRTKRCG
jgi:hypothetical protein